MGQKGVNIRLTKGAIPKTGRRGFSLSRNWIGLFEGGRTLSGLESFFRMDSLLAFLYLAVIFSPGFGVLNPLGPD